TAGASRGSLYLLCEIPGGGRTFDPIYVPGGVHGDEGERTGGEPGFMHHFCGHVVEGAGTEFAFFAVASEDGSALKDGVGFIPAVPMFANMNGLGRADHEFGGLGFWIYVKNGYFR